MASILSPRARTAVATVVVTVCACLVPAAPAHAHPLRPQTAGTPEPGARTGPPVSFPAPSSEGGGVGGAVPVVTDPATATDPATIADDRVAPELLGVAIEGTAYEAAMATYRTLAAQLDQSRATYRTADDVLVELDAQEIALRRQLRTSTARRQAAAEIIADLQATIDEVLVTAYVSGDPAGSLTEPLTLADATDQGARRTLTHSVLDRHRVELAAALADRDRAQREEERTSALLDSVIARRDETRFARESALVAAFLLTTQLQEQAVAVADARLTSHVIGTDFSFVALDAYWKAAVTLATEVPSCGIRWQILAGISRTEGRHGTYGGSAPDGDGNVEPPIIGIPLNGSNNTARITDSDGGMWDGDGVHDRAVGPMQFIPSSWRFYGADGNGDGEADPQNLYDATLAAGRLLCRQGTAYHTETGLRGGLLTYNRSNHYVDVVAANIAHYDELDLR